MADIAFVRGDTYQEDWTFTDARSGTPFALTGATLWFSVKVSSDATDAQAVLQLTNGSGIAITDAANGRATLTVSAAQSAALVPGAPYVWDVQVVAADGTVKTADGGLLTVSADVTRRTS